MNNQENIKITKEDAIKLLSNAKQAPRESHIFDKGSVTTNG